MLARRIPTIVVSRFASTLGAGDGSTGIEHALKFKQTGKGHKQDFKDYKCSEYLHYNQLSFYTSEVSNYKFFG